MGLDDEVEHELERELQDELTGSDPESLSSGGPSPEQSTGARPATHLCSHLLLSRNNTPSIEPPSPEDVRNASYRIRAGPYCLHETVQRYWNVDPITPLECENKDCGRPARFLYECSADTAEYSSFNPVDPERKIEILPDWVQKSVAKGHYLSDQVEKLLDQKMHVLETAAYLQGQVPPIHRALPGGRGLPNDQEAIEQRDYREIMQLLSARTLNFSNLEPCRAMFCTMCRSYTANNSWGSIDKIVNEPYEEPLRTPGNLYRPITDARVLRGLPEDPTHWKHTLSFRDWWDQYQYTADNDIAPIFNLIEGLKLPFECLQSIQGWIDWQQMPKLEFYTYLDWLETLTQERLQEHATRIGDPWELPFKAEEISYSYISPGTQPLPLSMHPIWEEMETQDEVSGKPVLVDVPQFEYGANGRFVGRNADNLRRAAWDYYYARDQSLELAECSLESAAAESSLPGAMNWETLEGVEPSTADASGGVIEGWGW